MAASVLACRDLAGPYRLPPQRRPQIDEEITALALAAIAIEPGAAADTTEWLREAGRQLQLPEHFGGNFDALYDCLCDRDLLPQPGLVLLIGNTAPLGEDGLDTLIAVLQAVADEWREQQRGFWALFTAPGIDLDPLPKAPA